MKRIFFAVLAVCIMGNNAFCQEEALFTHDYYYVGMGGYAVNTSFTIYPGAVVNNNSQAVYELISEQYGIRTYKGNYSGNTWTELSVDGNFDIVEKTYMDTGYLPYVGRLTYLLWENHYSKGHVENVAVSAPVYVPVVPYTPYSPYTQPYDYRTWHVCPYCRGMGYTTVYHPHTPPGHIPCSFCQGRGIYQM